MISHGYEYNVRLKSFMTVCHYYQINAECGDNKYEYFFSEKLTFDINIEILITLLLIYM